MSSKIRFMQAASCPMDAWCSNRPLWKNCPTNSCSQYYDIDYGSHSIIICDALSGCPSYNSYAYFPENSFNTLVASGQKNINIFVTPDGLKIPGGTNKAYIRFINLAYDEPCLDFRFSDGILAIARNIGYQEVTNYYPITASCYTMQVFRCNSNRALLNLPNITLKADCSYTFYITGSLVNRPNYDYLVCQDAMAPICPPPHHHPEFYPPSNHCCGKDSFCSDNFYCGDTFYY